MAKDKKSLAGQLEDGSACSHINDQNNNHNNSQIKNKNNNSAALFSLTGRIDAWRFLAYFIIYNSIYVLVIIVSAWIFIPLFSSRPDLNITSLPILLLLALYLLSFLPQHIPARRRLADLNKNGKWSLLLVIPVVNVIFVVYLLLVRGAAATNDYGQPPSPSSWGLKIFCLLAPIGIALMIAAVIHLWKISL